jgi:hypothetical protein
MSHRMVLAALGAPENKVRDQPSGDAKGGRYEEWIYGHVPQTVRFVRFVGDRVTVVEIAALGKPIEIRDQDEVGELNPSMPTREVAMGDQQQADGDSQKSQAAPPTLRKPGEAAPAGGENKVQFPTASKPSPIPPTPTSSTTIPATGADPNRPLL